ncbi:hypothetical protein LELG_04425 [Lodderomyces elongisporus NRRL YB-4239]|uniref:Uncharacterized protein n=1 Tax=Lodderomyces elongisporus (strain ATCC 11503 / CBS 2605 / JCM 1781 / NBRC 1676 / NRRL YB-4239) TaxID=379508 RepID=A5E486_LODEL|nr:hypothetical protein LELG_04425 [Lodderomyces elongisporus NRRL YB-4239]
MKSFLIASVLTLSSTALAAVRNVQLYVNSENAGINGLGLYSTHEGAGVNYFFLGEAAQTVQYDDEAKNLFIELNTQPPARQSLAFEGQFLGLTVGQDPLPVEIQEDGSVVFEGSTALAAAKNVDDPYRYSEALWAVVNSAPEGSIPLSIQAVFVEETESENQEQQQEDSLVASTEDVTEGTVVPEETLAPQVVTVFTTYCPVATTLTLTVCEEVCQESQYVVSEPGTVTIANVVVTETPAPVEEPVVAVETPQPEVPADVSVYEGSAAKFGGAASIAAIALAVVGVAF